MSNDVKFRDGKLHYNINREASKILEQSSGETDKYEYLLGGKLLPSNQRQIE